MQEEKSLFQRWFKTGRYVFGPVELPIEDRNHCIEFEGGAYVELVHDTVTYSERENQASYLVTIGNDSRIFKDIESAAHHLFREFAIKETTFSV